jgi:hypothetical protein
MKYLPNSIITSDWQDSAGIRIHSQSVHVRDMDHKLQLNKQRLEVAYPMSPTRAASGAPAFPLLTLLTSCGDSLSFRLPGMGIGVNRGIIHHYECYEKDTGEKDPAVVPSLICRRRGEIAGEMRGNRGGRAPDQRKLLDNQSIGHAFISRGG